MSDLKSDVRDFWEEESCGERYSSNESNEIYREQFDERYQLEPWITRFANFNLATDKDVLEIGVGMGADHSLWASNKPRSLHGVDLTERAVVHTKARFEAEGLHSELCTADAENLPFDDASFDIVYSYGVIHHSPDTQAAINQINRVLRPEGMAKVMVYHKKSLVGAMLWCRYALLKGKPFTSLSEIYSKYLESPGTKAYTVHQVEEMFKDFSACETEVELSIGDLLEGKVGARHQGTMLSFARRIWPRKLIKKFFQNYGLVLLISAKK